MKKHILTLSFAMAALFIISSCGKYEEGPGVSLLSKKARITGVWKLDKMIVNGVEQTIEEEMKNATTELMKDGTGKITVTFMGMTLNFDMEWEFNDDKTKLKTRMKDFLDPEVWEEWVESEILRLTNKELWLKDVETEDGETYTTITHMVKE
jgi:hypothetical protein